MKRLRSICFRGGVLWLAILTAVAVIPASGQTNSYWTVLEICPTAYSTPYHISLFAPENGEDGARTWSQTKSVFVYGLGVIGVLAMLPKEYTGWDKDSDIFDKWVDNITEGPEWDRNNWAYNYIGHTYFGGVYYQVARKSGYRQWDAFVYALLMSTHYWECGVEAFAEVPSVQDLVVTPLMGWVYGEWAYRAELRIRDAGGKVAGSRALGGVALFLLDPIDALGCGVNRVTRRRLVKSGYGYFAYTASPNETITEHTIYLNMVFPLGGSEPTTQYELRRTHGEGDPVDTGIVGISLGTGRTFLDQDWDVEDDLYTTVSMGLYFTPRFSARLVYAQGDLTEHTTGRVVDYENYSLNAQYYLNAERKVRPFVTVGLGEQMWDDRAALNAFQWNAGIGLHYRIHGKWALQADWLHYYSTSEKTYDRNVNMGLVYRFGRGEHDDW
ncbi:MAG: DUF3943 domain-containing protein [Verrucomicrobia bacterium]|jgi:hypothetical protein|nr:DUF3943 domain-containing protein [Verrucomicrobiota bacterium]